eukprot:XP_015572474.1 LRR receptor-like serine/threonine-protein kinase EFR [Ricinus communis]
MFVSLVRSLCDMMKKKFLICWIPKDRVFKSATANSVAGNNKSYGGIGKFQLPESKFKGTKRGRLALSMKLIIVASGALRLLSGSVFSFSCSFGSVYKGTLNRDGKVIAADSKSFIVEREVCRNVKHQKFVKFITVCSSVDYEVDDCKALVWEFMV